MKILLAEDDPISTRLVKTRLQQWGHEVVAVSDGLRAYELLTATDGPPLALVDWMMPQLDGIEVCRRIRALPRTSPCYIILVTARSTQEDLVEGIEAGADDYVVKPFDAMELKARINAGIRIIELQQALHERVIDLEKALSTIKILQGLLPICSYCKKVRDDENNWQPIETFITARSGAEFSHGICPCCYNTHVQTELDRYELPE